MARVTDPVSEALAAAGLPAAAAVLVGPPVPDAPPPPEGPWVVMPHGGGYVVGAMGRGQFREYDKRATLEEASALTVHLAGDRVVRVPAEPGERSTTVTRERILARTRERGGAGPAMVGPGDVLDCFGPDTGHHVYAVGTPFAERSQPPTDASAAYHVYRVLTLLADASEGVAAPWFGQPGGGAMMVLKRPIRWYVDHGHLAELEQ